MLADEATAARLRALAVDGSRVESRGGGRSARGTSP